MILDERTEFADATSVAAAAGTALIGDVYDTGETVSNMGVSSDLWFVITVDTEIITAGAAGTVRFQLVSDATSTVATDGSATVHLDTGTLVSDDAAANDSRLNAGATLYAAKLPSMNYERWLGVLCITATTTTTAGKINAFLTPTLYANRHYPDAQN